MVDLGQDRRLSDVRESSKSNGRIEAVSESERAAAKPAPQSSERPPHKWELLAARLPEDQALWFWVRAKLKFGPCAKRREDRLLRLLFGAEFDESRARAQAWLRRG